MKDFQTVGTIDVTPKWEEYLLLLAEMTHLESPQARGFARAELRRAGRHLDGQGGAE